MVSYRLTLRFVLEKFDEVEVELSSLEAMNRFLSDNRMLAVCLGYCIANTSESVSNSVIGALVVERKSGDGLFSYAFHSYNELSLFLSDNPECAHYLSGKQIQR